MPEAPVPLLIAADALCLLGCLAGVLGACRKPTLLLLLIKPLFALALAPWAMFLLSTVAQVSSGTGQANGLTIASLFGFTALSGVASGAGGLALTNRPAIEWWMEQQISRYENPLDAPSEKPLSLVLSEAPPAARHPVRGWTVLTAVMGAIGLAFPWLLL